MLSERKHKSRPRGLSGVYQIKNLVNGKVYIGSSISCDWRWSVHKTELNCRKHHSKHLESAWLKYGADNFVFEVIEECQADKSALLFAEQGWLDKLHPWNPLYGYNTSKYAHSPLGVKRSAETRALISRIQIGRKTPDHVKMKISHAQIGRKKSDLHVFNMSLGQSFFKGKTLSELLRLRAIGWSSLKLAAHFGCNKSTVLRTINGKQTAHALISDPLPRSKWNLGRFKPASERALTTV